MAKICLCLTAKTIQRNLEILNKYRKYADIAELRVDCLDPDERYLIRKFPGQAGLPVILTIRRAIDGGYFIGGEGSRVSLLARGLAYAKADRRLNFAYVDIEEDLNVPNLEEAARTFGTRIIRSWHSTEGDIDQIPEKISSMKCIGDDIIKIAVNAKSASDVAYMLKAARQYKGKDKIFLCMGEYGTYSRILTEQFKSYLSYSSALKENDIVSGAPGQTDIQDLTDLYQFRSINSKTRLYGILSDTVNTHSPENDENRELINLFNFSFKQDELNAVFVPFPAVSAVDFMELTKELNISGFLVNRSFCTDIIPYVNEQSSEVLSSGACDTISKTDAGWTGSNMSILAFSDLLLEFYGKKNIHRKKITLIGSSIFAWELACELKKTGAKILVLNRNDKNARELAVKYNFSWESMNFRGIERVKKFNDIIISADLPEEGFSDPLEMYDFNGKEAVMDLRMNFKDSVLLKRAADAGCKVIDAAAMLARQIQYQYSQLKVMT